jgi:hypothetical protein
MKNIALLILLASVCSGCGPSPTTLGESVEIKGVVKRNSGAKVGDVNITLQPLGPGVVSVLSLDTSDRFSGTAIPGKYAYYVSANTTKKDSSKAVASYPEAMQSANMERTVTIAPGKELEILLD